MFPKYMLSSRFKILLTKANMKQLFILETSIFSFLFLYKHKKINVNEFFIHVVRLDSGLDYELVAGNPASRRYI